MSSDNINLKSNRTLKEHQKPEMLKSWKTKLLVLLLCTVSFYAGWQASRSYLVKACYKEGGQPTVTGNIISCSLPN